MSMNQYFENRFFLKLLLIIILIPLNFCENKNDVEITGLLSIPAVSEAVDSTSSSSASESSTTTSSSSTSQTEVTLSQISTGVNFNCALFSNKKVKCWGKNDLGQLGYGDTSDRGDDETLDTIGYVDVGADVEMIDIGTDVCVVTTSGNVKCWGPNVDGSLGYGNLTSIGDDEAPSSVGYVNVGTGTVSNISTGFQYSCVLFSDGTITCWGNGDKGRLGYGNQDDIGDNETPASIGNVPVGATVSKLYTGYITTCVITSGGTTGLKCWGLGIHGKRGYSDTADIGDDELPSTIGNVSLGGTPTQVAMGAWSTCVLLSNGNVRCFGYNFAGQLGYGTAPTKIGDNETPDTAGPVDFGVGRTAVAISGHKFSTCAILDNNSVYCWGENDNGELGYGHMNSIGDDESVGSVTAVSLGSGLTPSEIHVGDDIACIISTNSSVNSKVKCWGNNTSGELGQGNETVIGDNESPSTISPITFLSSSQLTGYLLKHSYKNLYIILGLSFLGLLTGIYLKLNSIKRNKSE